MLAEKKASKGKRKKREVRLYQANLEKNIAALHEMLVNKTYRTSPYHVFKIYEPKERDISKLPYRDRIVHHAIMNYLEDVRRIFPSVQLLRSLMGVMSLIKNIL